MAAKLHRPRIGERWTRVRNTASAGMEIAYVRGIREGHGPKVEYRHDSKRKPGTHVLDLRTFLANFAPPGQTEPLMPEADTPYADPDKNAAMHLLRPSLRVMAEAGR